MELQLFIIWNTGYKFHQNIIQSLSSVFQIKAVYMTEWNKATTLNKMIKLYDFSSTEAKTKISECGYGKTIIVIVEDLHPSKKLHITKYGNIEVSKHALEIKEKIRNDYQNKNIIHGTMLDFEFNNDIKICLNKTREDFINELSEGEKGDICII